MEVEVNYFVQVTETRRYQNGGGFYSHSSTQLKEVEIIKADDEISIFEIFYKKNNRLRYCNGYYYEFVSPIWKKKYDDWLKSDDYKQKSFNLYYGDGIVD
jgi:hypothetical protein